VTAIKKQQKKKKRGEDRAERYRREIRAGDRYREFLRDMAKMVSAFPTWMKGPTP
jgi:hypothetical protein